MFASEILSVVDNQNPPAQQPQPPVVSQPSSEGPRYGKKNWVKWVLIFIAIAVPLALLAFVLWSISGIYMGNSYLDGVVVDHDTKAPVADVRVVISNRGWGIANGRVVWDQDYDYSAVTDQLGRFHLIYQIGSSAHVIITKDGFERYDNWFDRNTKATIELKHHKTQIQDETVNTEASRSANWKTYTSQELGFSIKYPQEWLVYDNSIPPCTHGIPGTVVINKTTLKDCSFETSLPDFYVFVEKEPRPSPPSGLRTRSTIKISGETAALSFTSEKPVTMRTNIELNHKNRAYGFSFANTDYLGNHEPIYDQILSTFTFN